MDGHRIPKYRTVHKAFIPNNLMHLAHPYLKRSHLGLFFVLSVVVSCLISCGYRTVGASSTQPEARVTLSVIPFTNRTRVPTLETRMTDALRRAMVESQTFDLTSATTTAQLLHGTVNRFHRRPISFNANDNVRQYRLETDIVIRVVDRVSQTIIFEQEISAWAEYLVSDSGDVRENIIAQEAALFRLAQQFSRKCTALLTAVLL